MYLPDRINSVFRCNFLDNFSSKKFARRKSGTKRIVFQPYFDPPPTGRKGVHHICHDGTRYQTY